MKQYAQSRAAGIVLALAAWPAAAAGPNDGRQHDLKLISEGERAWGQAFVSGNVSTADRLLAEDFIGVDTRGRRYDKASILQYLRSGPRLTSDKVDSVVVRFYGDTAVVQANEHQVGPAPQMQRLERVFTDTWVRLKGQWRIVAAQDVDVKH